MRRISGLELLFTGHCQLPIRSFVRGIIDHLDRYKKNQNRFLNSNLAELFYDNVDNLHVPITILKLGHSEGVLEIFQIPPSLILSKVNSQLSLKSMPRYPDATIRLFKSCRQKNEDRLSF